jgi:hypothetical protein
MKHNSKQPRASKKERASTPLFERIQLDAAGIDCGQNSHFVAVPPERDRRAPCPSYPAIKVCPMSQGPIISRSISGRSRLPTRRRLSLMILPRARALHRKVIGHVLRKAEGGKRGLKVQHVLTRGEGFEHQPVSIGRR